MVPFLVLLSLLPSTRAVAPLGKYFALEHYRQNGLHQADERGLKANAPTSLRFFTQRQDHFDGANPNTWQQAYYVNDSFWKGPDSGAPIFLCVGGEGPPLTPAVVSDSVHCSNAASWLPETGALMFAVEHRYYGCHNSSACPVSDFDDPPKVSLRFLSSRQALSDLAQFHAFATEEYNLTAENKWVTFGGSYPGMLAGWFRIRFPHLAHASVASSAPVHAKVEMTEYNDWVRYAYTVQSVGGSQECSDAIADGHSMIGKLMNDADGRKRLAELFGLPSAEWLEEKENQKLFAGEGVAYFPSQGNDPSCEEDACNIARICDIMMKTNEDDNVDRLAAVKKAQASWLDKQMKEAEAMLGDFANYWGWQTCTEFGFYQTCDTGSHCPYTQGLDLLSDQLQICAKFNISPDTVAANVAFTNVYYGGLSPVATRVMWPNGEVDPWSQLAVLNTTAPEQPTLWVAGASHHFWTHTPLPTDQTSVQDARTTIRDQVKAWLK
eukprot:CAMPEP_0114523406 /NCGR_PEP_ID=MMETSP0109-20121206/21271_1 /TAXON_ID=29199 /ORGANISM="Chlorarachnion reptans, Strain CCCM449" /LENGTH=493 /DNA_ID=CAMNT_0001704713 /DNA_START=32 /DNA_END=1513 /DNA_ORIENTATION=+